MVLNALNKAFKIAKPQILNSDQGSQFTSQQYIDFVKENGIRQSMDGKSRWADNIMIERWFRSFKYEEAYLTQYNNIKEARVAIKRYVHTYNFERYHSALDYLYHQSILTLNSIMFLLILILNDLSRLLLCSLNSIMFLLIQYRKIKADLQDQTLNSIMFLLIPTKKFDYKIKANYFKFHYVSINSSFSASASWSSFSFKFHYVSINSV